MKITKHDKASGRFELEKRTYLPFTVESACPKCGATCVRDLSDDYLSYPVVGEPESVHFNHECHDGGYVEWGESVVVGFTLEPAP